MISEAEFNQLVGGLSRAPRATRVEFWNHVAKIASNNDSPMREVLETKLKSRDLEKSMKSDMDSSATDVKCAVVLAAGYCVARPHLARHIDNKSLIKTLVSVPASAQYNKQLSIKCVWAVANVKQTQVLSEMGTEVMAFVCDILKRKVLEDDVAVDKELLRLLDKMLVSLPSIACQLAFLPHWLHRVLSLTVNKLQVIREKSRDLLKNHVVSMLKEAANDINRIVAQQLFVQSSSANKPSSVLLQELQELAGNGHSGYVIEVWLCLVRMTSKMIMKKTAFSNQLFSIPNFFTKNLIDDASRLALLDSWIVVVDIYRSDNPDFFATSKQMKFFMTPFFTIKQPSLQVHLALVRSWWYLVVACQRMNYVNTFTAVLEPCIKACFKNREIGELVQEGANMLHLLLDSTPPECDLVTIAPSSLNLSDSYHSVTFFKYFDTLIRYKPDNSGLVIAIWGKVCDCAKGTPDPRKMMNILETAMEHLSPSTVLSMAESLSLSSVMTSQHKGPVAEYIIKCSKTDDLKVGARLQKLLKSVPFDDPSYLTLSHHIISYLSSDDVEGIGVHCLSAVWNVVCNTLSEYIEETGGEINEGTRIEPKFITTHSVVAFVFTLFDEANDLRQTMIQSMCQAWERLMSLFVEHTSQYKSVNVTDYMVSLVLESYVQTSALYPMIFCTKVLVEESPVAQLSILQSSSYSVLQLVSTVLQRVHTVSKSHGLEALTLSLCIELCTSCWALLTPGKMIPALTSIKSSYLGLLAPDKNYPPAVQNIIKTSYTSLLASIQKHMTFYTHTELDCLEEYLIYGLKHHKKLIRLAAAKFWNSTFGIAYSGSFSPQLRAVIETEAKRSALIVPSTSAGFSIEKHSQTTEISDQMSKCDEVLLKGSFLRKEIATSKHIGDAAMQAPPSKTPPSKAPPANTRSIQKRLINEESQDCIFISTSPKKQKILTRHQKEKILEQRLDRDVPMMYNSLDVNSQEPMLFDMNSQSEPPITPEREEAQTLPKAATPSFSSRKLLFLSPGIKKPASESVIARSIAMLPTSSPDLPVVDPQTDNPQSDSQEDLYCDSPEECTEETESVLTPPSTDIPGTKPPSIMITGSYMQPTLPAVSEMRSSGQSHSSTLSHSKGISPISPNNRSIFTSVLKSMMNYISPSQEKPSSLVLAADSDSGSKSSCSETTPVENKSSKNVTIPMKSSGDSATLDLNSSSASTPLLPKESIIDKMNDTVTETPSPAVMSVILVEDSQDSLPPDVELLGTNLIKSSTSLLEHEYSVNLKTFSKEISFSDCSTALEVSQTSKKEVIPEQITRRSTMPEKMKSDDLGIRTSGSKFKRVRSSEDWTELNAAHLDRFLRPIKEKTDLAPLRKSVRPRKSSVKLQDYASVNPNVPVSILSHSSSSQDSKVSKESTMTATNNGKTVKKKLGRPPKKRNNSQTPFQDLENSDVCPIPVPDIPTVSTATIIEEDCVQFSGKAKQNKVSKDLTNNFNWDSVESTLSSNTKCSLGKTVQDSLQSQDDAPVKRVPECLDQVSIPDSLPILHQNFDSDPATYSTKQRRSTRIVKKTVTIPELQGSPNSNELIDIITIENSQENSIQYDTKTLITDYLPKTIKLEITNTVKESSVTDQLQELAEPNISEEKSAIKVEIKPFSSDCPSTIQEDNSSECKPVQLLSKENDFTEFSCDSQSVNDNSLVFKPLPKSSPASTSPQETESVASSSSQRVRRRKQSQPKKSAGPKRKSTRLNSKSQQSIEDTPTDSSTKDSQVVVSSSQTFVPDSVQAQESDTFEESNDTLTHVSTENLSCEKRVHPVSQSSCIIPEKTSVPDDIPSSQVLSLEVSFSQKKEVFSPEEIHKEHPLSILTVECLSKLPSSTLTSTESIETFGKEAVKETFDLDSQLTQDRQQTPPLGSDTIKDLPLLDDGKKEIARVKEDKIEVKGDASPYSKYNEFDEFDESDISVMFCTNSQVVSSLVENFEHAELESSSNVIPDSQVSEDTGQLEQLVYGQKTKRSLRRKPSFPSNLPDVMQDLVAIDLSQAENLESDVKTPPKIHNKQGGQVTPTTPRTPSSILKRAKDPGSGSPSSSKRHVTFGPLPGPRRDPNEVTPRRQNKFRKSPALPLSPHVLPVPTNEAIYPSLVHCTVLAHNIIRNLCSGFSLSQRTFNLSIASSSIKTIGDLARLTPAQVEEFAFIAPKLIQVRRQLKKYESSLSPTISAKSFLLETKVREQLKAGVESLETVAEAGMEKENVPVHLESIQLESEDISITAVKNVPDVSNAQSKDLPNKIQNEFEDSGTKNMVSTLVENDDKENIDPNQNDSILQVEANLTDEDGKSGVLGTCSTQQEESTDETAKASPSELECTTEEVQDIMDVEENMESNQIDSASIVDCISLNYEPPTALIRNKSYKSAVQAETPTIVVGINVNDSKAHDTRDNNGDVETHEGASIETDIRATKSAETCLPECSDLDEGPTSDDDLIEVEHELIASDDIPTELGHELIATDDISTELGHKLIATDDIPKDLGHELIVSDDNLKELRHGLIATDDIPKESGHELIASDDEIDVMISRYSPTNNETVNVGHPTKCGAFTQDQDTFIAKVESCAIQKIDQKCLEQTENELLQSTDSDSVSPAPDLICEDSPLDLICHEKLSAEMRTVENETCIPESSIESISQCISKNISDLAKETAIPHLTESEEEMMDIEDLIHLVPSKQEVSSTNVITALTESSPTDDCLNNKSSDNEIDAICSDAYSDMHPLVDYPNTQPNLVDYPLTQQEAISFEEEIELIERKLRTIPDVQARVSERFKIIERLCRNNRNS